MLFVHMAGLGAPVLLYALPVLCRVYPLLELGRPLGKERVAARGPVVGNVHYRERIPRSGIKLATLTTDRNGTYGLPPIDKASVEMLDIGFLITGNEVVTRSPSPKSRFEQYPQTWWCVPCQPDHKQSDRSRPQSPKMKVDL